MTKKILALVLALVMVFAMTACTSTEEPAESPAATDDAGTESTEPTRQAEISYAVFCLKKKKKKNRKTGRRLRIVV